jgi:hypothetical protein
MITEAEFLEHRWRKLDENTLYKLGVMVKLGSDMNTPAYTEIDIYHDVDHKEFSVLSVPKHLYIDALENAVKYGINYIFTRGTSVFPITPKQKRTLNNWLL